MIAHVIQWLLMGKTVSPIEPSEAMFTLQNGAVNAGFIFFSLAILATLIFGRFVCGWGCHIVALQDFCGWLLKKFGLKPKPFRSRLLTFVPLIVALYMFVYPTVARYFAKPKNEPLFSQWTNHLITTEFWATFPPYYVAIPFLFICGFMTVYFLGQKGFCTYACPYGGFFSVADKIAPGKIRVTDACNQCGHCTAVCTSNVLVHAEVKEYGMVVDQGCMKCMDCVSVCPNDALYFGFGKPSASVSAKTKKNYLLVWLEEFGGFLALVLSYFFAFGNPVFIGFVTYIVLKAVKILLAKDEKTYSLTRLEEIAAAIIFALSYFAVWNVYQLVPMLMALGIATVTTFLAMRTWRLFRAKDLSFYRYNLKSAGKIKTVGLGFLLFALSWIGLNVHSGIVLYHEAIGKSAFERLQIPDELALAQLNPTQWLSANDKKYIAEGKKNFQTARKIGLVTNVDAMPKLAWLEYLSGNADEAIKLLDTSAQYQTGPAKALNLYYRGAILNRSGRYEEALKSLDESVSERPDLITALEEKGESFWKLGRKDEAIRVWHEAVKQKPNLPLANYFLAAALPEESLIYQKQADRVTPNDPLFHWMLGLRLKNIGMNELAEKHFNRAIQMNPNLKSLRK
jgi:tetratricopeptide (TPR) repeat protein/NAD-dependent dihydropyrimidine dehydrogenase PreA subunit